jgi:hypothetical protein
MQNTGKWQKCDVFAFAERLRTILHSGSLYFAIDWDTDEFGNVDGASIDDSYEWCFGVKVVECFDAACMLFEQVGGEKWLAYNITEPMYVKDLAVIAKQILVELEIENVCVWEGAI